MSMSRRRFLSLSGAAMAAAASGRVSRAAAEPASLADGINAFGFDLYQRLSRTPGNLAFSPTSLSTALSLTSGGARGNTLAEMNTVLHLPANPHAEYRRFLERVFAPGRTKNRPYELTVANAVWGQRDYPWRKEFQALASKDYLAGLFETDFARSEAARGAINAWVEKQTREKIRDLIPAGAVTPLTRMVLTNAMYFKGDWATQFLEKGTKEAPFHLDGGERVTVPMMSQSADFPYAEVEYDSKSPATDSVQILALPYAGHDLSMVLLKPIGRGLASLERAMTAAKLAEWLKTLHERKVNVRVPKFKLEAKEPLILNEPLQAMGMKDAFSESKADFGGLHAGKEPLHITAVVHKAFVEINEKGTEAAAASGVVIGLRGAQRDTEFLADRPFLFLIRENKTGAILFFGRVSNPKA